MNPDYHLRCARDHLEQAVRVAMLARDEADSGTAAKRDARRVATAAEGMVIDLNVLLSRPRDVPVESHRGSTLG